MLTEDQIKEIISLTVLETVKKMVEKHNLRVSELIEFNTTQVNRRREYEDAIRNFKTDWDIRYPGETPRCPHIKAMFDVYNKYLTANTVTQGG